jgi:amidase
MIEMGVDIVYPIELPSQASLTIDGKNCFEPVVCESDQHSLTKYTLTVHRLGVQRMSDRVHP